METNYSYFSSLTCLIVFLNLHQKVMSMFLRMLSGLSNFNYNHIDSQTCMSENKSSDVRWFSPRSRPRLWAILILTDRTMLLDIHIGHAKYRAAQLSVDFKNLWGLQIAYFASIIIKNWTLHPNHVNDFAFHTHLFMRRTLATLLIFQQELKVNTSSSLLLSATSGHLWYTSCSLRAQTKICKSSWLNIICDILIWYDDDVMSSRFGQIRKYHCRCTRISLCYSSWTISSCYPRIGKW